uniref:No apical meristem-associated C-terminal domain-containing protein n=1 Tax=Kalanchoe fedtschenkoi TaxID=63787 RepID=A0A7N0TRE8_KALFE
MSDHPFRGGFMNFMNSPNFGNSPPPPNSNSQNTPTHNQFPSTPPTPHDTQFMNYSNHAPFSYLFFLNSSQSFSPGYYGVYGQNIMSRPFMVSSPSQPTEGNPEYASMAENEAPHSVSQQVKNSRPIKWSAEEEEMLISAWITISNDSAVGNSQTRGSFWARVAGYFNTYRKTKFEREESQLKSHYYLMMPQVNEFNDNQIIEAARLIWKNAHKKKEFPYTHVWEMVKDEPKWAVQAGAQNASKKTKTSESGAYTSSSNHDIEENTYEGNESESRPIAAKRKMRGKEKKNATESVAEEFNHRWKRLEELQSEKLAVLNEIKNKAKEDTLRADYEILMKDSSTMSDQQLIIHNHMCSIIKARHGIP